MEYLCANPYIPKIRIGIMKTHIHKGNLANYASNCCCSLKLRSFKYVLIILGISYASILCYYIGGVSYASVLLKSSYPLIVPVYKD